MARTQPYLELRPTGYFWRRRIPVACGFRIKPGFLCFPLRTKVLREAAVVAHRLTALSDICFNAETDVPPEVMTSVLTTYALAQIETADRLRALTGPRTRIAAEAALTLESALRAALRQDIFLGEREKAVDAISLTAHQLGIEIDPDEEDFGVLVDRMLRLMLEVSEERERRAKGIFAETQPYLGLALSQLSNRAPIAMAPIATTPSGLTDAATPAALSPPSPAALPQTAEGAPPAAATKVRPRATAPGRPAAVTPTATRLPPSPAALPRPAAPAHSAAETEDLQPALCPAEGQSRSEQCDTAAESGPEPTPEPTDEPMQPQACAPDERILASHAAGEVRFASAVPADSKEPTLLALFDDWFAEKSAGVIRQGAIEVQNDTSGLRFRRNSDTTLSSRKILENLIGDRQMSTMKFEDWQDFLKLLMKLPKNHGKSPKDLGKSYRQLVAEADAKDEKALRSASRTAKIQSLDEVATQVLIAEAKVPRLSARTVQRHQMTLAAAFDHAVTGGRIGANGFRAFVLSDKTVAALNTGKPSTKRKLWHDELYDLLRTKCWNSAKTRLDDHMYWAPLIARLGFLRSEEILQLKTADIRIDDGIWYFDVVQGTGQSLKSDNGPRAVPVHAQLIELGFLELVAQQRKNGQKRLFPRATRGKSAKLSFTANFTKSFKYYRERVGVYEASMDFHALRTTGNSVMVAQGVPDTARRYLMGHENPDVGIRHYLPEGFPLATLKAHIEKQQLDLSMVTQRFAKPADTPRGPLLVVSNPATDGGALTQRSAR